MACEEKAAGGRRPALRCSACFGPLHMTNSTKRRAKLPDHPSSWSEIHSALCAVLLSATPPDPRETTESGHRFYPLKYLFLAQPLSRCCISKPEDLQVNLRFSTATFNCFSSQYSPLVQRISPYPEITKRAITSEKTVYCKKTSPKITNKIAIV